MLLDGESVFKVCDLKPANVKRNFVLMSWNTHPCSWAFPPINWFFRAATSSIRDTLHHPYVSTCFCGKRFYSLMTYGTMAHKSNMVTPSMPYSCYSGIHHWNIYIRQRTHWLSLALQHWIGQTDHSHKATHCHPHKAECYMYPTHASTVFYYRNYHRKCSVCHKKCNAERWNRNS